MRGKKPNCRENKNIVTRLRKPRLYLLDFVPTRLTLSYHSIKSVQRLNKAGEAAARDPIPPSGGFIVNTT